MVTVNRRLYPPDLGTLLPLPQVSSATAPPTAVCGVPLQLQLHHTALGMQLLANPNYGILQSLSKSDQRNAKRDICGCLLGTDMALHKEVVSHGRAALASAGLSHEATLRLLLKTAQQQTLHGKGFSTAQQWALAQAEEFAVPGQLQPSQGLAGGKVAMTGTQVFHPVPTAHSVRTPTPTPSEGRHDPLELTSPLVSGPGAA